METTHKAVLVAALTALVIAGGVALLTPKTTTEKTIERVVQETLGAIPGTDVSGPDFSIGGVKKFYAQQTLTTGTTTVCRLRSSAQASSTLISGGIRFIQASTTQAILIAVTRSENQFATSTGARILVPLATSTITADTTGNHINFMATNTYPVANENLTDLIANDRVFAPGEYIVVSMAGGQHPRSDLPTGVCQAEWQVF